MATISEMVGESMEGSNAWSTLSSQVNMMDFTIKQLFLVIDNNEGSPNQSHIYMCVFGSALMMLFCGPTY